MRALWTPMLMKYWVPCLILGGAMIYVADNLTLKKSKEKREALMKQGFGDDNRLLPGGITLSDRNRYMEEHLNRVIKGEDPWKVADELQTRYKQEQEIKGRLNRDNPMNNPMSQSPQTLANRSSKLKR